MKKAGKDLTTAHFTKNMLRLRNMQILFFFYKICFCIKTHFYNKSGNNVGHLI